MSENITASGKLIKVNLKNQTMYDYMRKKLDEKKIDHISLSNQEMAFEFYEYYYENYIILKNILYHLKSNNSVDADNSFQLAYDEDGNLNFFIQYYNGGCSMEEALEEAFKTLEPFTPDKLIFKKEYDGNSLVDVQKDMFEFLCAETNENMKDVPVDEYGVSKGTYKIKITWESDEK